MKKTKEKSKQEALCSLFVALLKGKKRAKRDIFFIYSLTHRLFFALSLSLCCGLFYSCALSASVSGFSLLPALFGLLLTSLTLGRCANVKGKVFGGSRPLPILDAFVVHDEDTSNYFYANNGSGEFTPRAVEHGEDAGSSEGAALGDLDGDGDLDVFVTNYGEANRIYINEGAGVFTVSAIEGDTAARMTAVE